MVTTDPAWQFRNDCIKFLVEAYNIDNWTAFCVAGERYITESFHAHRSVIDTCNEQLMRNDYNATTR